MPRTWKFHIVKNVIQTRNKFKWELRDGGKTIFESDQTFDDKAGARDEINDIKKAEIVED